MRSFFNTEIRFLVSPAFYITVFFVSSAEVFLLSCSCVAHLNFEFLTEETQSRNYQIVLKEIFTSPYPLANDAVLLFT